MSSAPSRSSTIVLRDAIRSAADVLNGDVMDIEKRNCVILVDGRSGAGKSTLARLLVERWPLGGPVQLLGLDSLYPGWDGLHAGVEAARAGVLQPYARSEVGVWRRWDWAAGRPAEAYAVDPSLPLVVEGSGLLTAETAALGDIRVWLDSPAVARRERALARDGDTYRPHWDRWARQETEHIARDAPQSLATRTFRLP